MSFNAVFVIRAVEKLDTTIRITSVENRKQLLDRMRESLNLCGTVRSKSEYF